MEEADAPAADTETSETVTESEPEAPGKVVAAKPSGKTARPAVAAASEVAPRPAAAPGPATDEAPASPSEASPEAAVPAAPPASASPKALGYAVIDTTPWTQVVWGQKRLGRTPVKVALPPGRHTLKLVNEVAGIEELLPLRIRSGQTVKRSLKLSAASLVLLVAPWGTVRVDGVERGRTPMPPVKLKPGVHRIEIENPETGKRWTKRLRVRSGETKRLKIDLR